MKWLINSPVDDINLEEALCKFSIWMNSGRSVIRNVMVVEELETSILFTATVTVVATVELIAANEEPHTVRRWKHTSLFGPQANNCVAASHTDLSFCHARNKPCFPSPRYSISKLQCCRILLYPLTDWYSLNPSSPMDHVVGLWFHLK